MDSFEKIRIGTGFDVHAFSDDKPGPVIVGNVKIDHPKALAGHSDADVLIHAVVDALLGAALLGDIGQFFPSTDDRWKGASSDEFLVWTRDQLKQKGIRILSIDACIMAQAPKMLPHIEPIRQRMAELLEIDRTRFFVKATTTDHLGFVGRKEGIACQASSLVLLPE